MSDPLRTFYDHSRHKLKIDQLDTHLDVLANQGLHNHPSQTDTSVNQPASHTDHRGQYAAHIAPQGEKTR